MELDDIEQAPTKQEIKNLEEMSIEKLGDYIDELKNEINRVEVAIRRKECARNGANAFFKS